MTQYCFCDGFENKFLPITIHIQHGTLSIYYCWLYAKNAHPLLSQLYVKSNPFMKSDSLFYKQNAIFSWLDCVALLFSNDILNVLNTHLSSWNSTLVLTSACRANYLNILKSLSLPRHFTILRILLIYIFNLQFILNRMTILRT